MKSINIDTKTCKSCHFQRLQGWNFHYFCSVLSFCATHFLSNTTFYKQMFITLGPILYSENNENAIFVFLLYVRWYIFLKLSFKLKETNMQFAFLFAFSLSLIDDLCSILEIYENNPDCIYGDHSNGLFSLNTFR